MISAKVIEHSHFYNTNDEELISIETYAPKFLDAEIEKHRMISSNSSSDRAIPVSRMITQDAFIPEDIRLNEKGMQGHKFLEFDDKVNFQEDLKELLNAIRFSVETWDKTYSIHKQHLNRYLTPFSFQKKIMTANKDQWDYFLSLRLHGAADPAIFQLAACINKAIIKSKSNLLKFGEWHLPYISSEEMFFNKTEDCCKMSAARCARVSYNNHEGKPPSKEQDFKLFDFLTKEKPQHATPTEHQATPMNETINMDSIGISHITANDQLFSGNFHSFIQFRKILEQKNWNL